MASRVWGGWQPSGSFVRHTRLVPTQASAGHAARWALRGSSHFHRNETLESNVFLARAWWLDHLYTLSRAVAAHSITSVKTLQIFCSFSKMWGLLRFTPTSTLPRPNQPSFPNLSVSSGYWKLYLSSQNPRWKPTWVLNSKEPRKPTDDYWCRTRPWAR